MALLGMVSECDEARSMALLEDWAEGSWLTNAVLPITNVIETTVGIVALPLDLIWSIPRALLTKTPVLNLAYLIPVYIVHFSLSVPTLGIAALWRSVPFVRGLLFPIGAAFAIVGVLWVVVAFMGGPGVDGAEKYHKRFLFANWPLVAELHYDTRLVAYRIAIR